MNKKFISALLFGAMLFAPASMFVSCSYDDDIAELRDDLNATKTDLSSLVDEKMKNVDAEIAALGAQAEALEAAYEAADEALQEAIANATNDAKGYADVQAAQAQAASIAAAQKMVEDAKTALEAALATVNSTVAEQGKSIAALLEADKELTTAISTAQARAEEAFALASQAKELATKNAADVEALSKVVDGLKTTLTTLSEQVTVLGENVTKALDEAKKNEAAIAAQAEALKVLEASNAKALETAKGELQDAIGANAKEIENLKKAVEAAKTEAAAAVAKAEAAAAQALVLAKEELQAAINANALKIEEVKAAYKDADAELKSELLLELGKMNDALTEEIEKNKAELAKVNANLAYQGKKLKSLVFNPNLYYGGIEAIGVYSFNYVPYQTLTAGNVNENQLNIVDKKQNQNSEVKFVPNEQISYIMNPSNAVVSDDVANYGFVLNHAKYTKAARSFDASDILVKKVVPADGKLTLTINMTDPDLIASLDNNAVDVVALKYTDKGENGDTTIVSDFAAIKHWRINEFTINSTKHGHKELYNTPQAAVNAYRNDVENKTNNGIYYTVAYKSNIDLKDQIDVHYSEEDTAKEWGNWETIAQKNFYFEYELIGYIANDQVKTNESKHAKLEGSLLTPQNADGTEANRSAVGRTPLVRIKLIDGNNNNNVVAVGYTVVVITDVSLEPIKFTYGSTTAFEVVCDPVEFTVGYMPTWEEFESQILSHERIGLSKSDFHSLYMLDVDGNNIAYQFVEAGKEATFGSRFGTVTEVKTGTGFETNVLQWTATNNEAYAWFKLNNQNQRNTSKSVIVRYVPRNTDAINHRPKIYLTLTWTPSAIETEPVAGITDNDKVANVWYAADANAEGFSDLHAHVNQEVGTPKFNFGVDKGTFRLGANSSNVLEVVKASLKANGYDKNNALADKTKVEFLFAVQGKVNEYKPAYNTTAGSAKGEKAYNLTVNNSRNKVYANGTLVASLNTTDGTITYEDSDIAKDILNYAESFDLVKGKTLTLQVELVAKTCEPASSITLNNNKVNVKFVRPLNLDNSTTVKITDSQDQKQTVALGKGKNKDNSLEIKFYDWRNYDNEEVYQYSGSKYNIYALYNITSIKQNPNSKVTTNYTGEWAEVDEKLFEFSYSGIKGSPVKSSDQGSITYEKKTSLTVRNFQAKIPVIVSYHWGNIYTYITVEVSATDGDN